MKRIVGLAFFVILLANPALTDGSARTWTSVSGAQVEARFIEFSAGFVVLEQSDGSRFQIHPSNLSQDDREHLSKLAGETHQPPADSEAPSVSPGTAPQPGVDRPGRPAAQDATEEGGHIFASDAFEEPKKLNASDFPNFTPSNPEEAKYVGLQYGPRAQDVVYIALDIEDSGELPKSIAVRNFGQARIRGDIYSLTPRRTSVRNHLDERVNVLSARLQTLNSSFGSVQIETEIDLVSGFGDAYRLHVFAENELTIGSERQSFGVGGQIFAKMTSGQGEIPVIRLFAEPVLRVQTRPFVIIGALNMDDWYLVPGRGMDRSVKLTISDEDGRVIETLNHSWDRTVMYTPPRGSAGLQPWKRPDALRETGTYVISSEIDLGSVFGKLQRERKEEVQR